MSHMKPYIHARLSKEDHTVLQELKRATGESESELVRRGLRRILADVGPARSALDAAGSSVGKFGKGPADLSTNRRHLDEFGK